MNSRSKVPDPSAPRVQRVVGWALFVLGAIVVFSCLYDLSAADLRSADLRRFVLLRLRVPRLLIGFLVGSTLSLVGAAFQTLFRNPLATPSTVGTTAGATLGALLALVFRLDSVWALPAVTASAFVGAFVSSSLVLGVALRGSASVEEILLAGIAVTLASGAIAQGLHVLADAETLFAAAQWSLGQLPQVGFDRVSILALPSVVCGALILSQRRGLSALALGVDRARSIGVNTDRVRALVLVGGCLGVGASVALCGPIAFVGLLVPHLVRRALGGHTPWFLPLCWICGGAFLLLCDALAHWALPGRELPVGVLTASLGAPALFALIFRGRYGVGTPP